MLKKNKYFPIKVKKVFLKSYYNALNLNIGYKLYLI